MEKRSTLTALIIVICFVIGCFFILMAVEEYIETSFDSDRYTIARVRTAESDSMTIWKLDKKTGVVEFCTKTSDIHAQIVCIKPVAMDAKDYHKPIDPDSVAQPDPGPASAVDPVAPVPAPQANAAPVKPEAPRVPEVPVKPEAKTSH